MKPDDRFSLEHRRQWAEFFKALHPDIDPQASRLMHEFRLVAHQVYRLSETNLDSSGLSYAQFQVLTNLRFCEWSGTCNGLNPSEISASQGTSRNTISALIRSLEEEGLVERSLDNQDRRRFNIHLTEAGRRKVADLAEQHTRLIGDLFSVLSPNDIETLSILLQKLSRRASVLKE